MRWGGSRESSNVEDRRGVGGGTALAGGGIGTIAIVLLGLFFGVDPSVLLDVVQQQPQSQVAGKAPEESCKDAECQFAARVLADTEDTWAPIFQQLGRTYRAPRLVVFNGGVQSACGSASSAVGPFYCPGDQKLYVDLDFLQELGTRFGAPGEFAKAYVIAHEVGHHVQHQLGLLKDTGRDAGAEGASVRTELQADCLAGVWAQRNNQRRENLDPGDIESGLGAASAVGDDRLQKRSQGRVVPDAFTHGSSAQRVRWFKRGFEKGDLRSCDTFNASQL
jgi:predicted metalloprotease